MSSASRIVQGAIARLAMASALLWLACSEVPQAEDGGLRGKRLATQALHAPGGGEWRTTSDLATARHRHTATLLPSGKVLVTGGFGPNGNVASALASAEEYDPFTGEWRSTAPLATARWLHTATLLPSGKVLVTGGFGPDVALASAELYDPDTRQWTPTGQMTTTRVWHTATLLSSGKVLVTGGITPSGILLTSEVYDPATGQWSRTGDLNQRRERHTATLLSSGKVLVTGGDVGLEGAPLRSTEVYDPDTGEWSTMGSLTTARSWHTATPLPSGKVLVTGGYGPGSAPIANAEVYDPVTNAWSPAGALATARREHTATLLPTGQVLVTGGYHSGSNYLDSVEVYSPATESWSRTGALRMARREHTATLLPSGLVLAIGGYFRDQYLKSAELYDSGTGAWSTARPMATPRYNQTATLLPPDKLLVAGGSHSGIYLPTAEVYDLSTGLWSPVGMMARGRDNHTATLLPSGKVLVAGGHDTGVYLDGAEEYDPATGTWSTTDSLSEVRGLHTATLLPSGKVLVTGGEGPGPTPLATSELYDPDLKEWSPAGSMATTRTAHTATLLPSGKVLVTGGLGLGQFLNSAELYDPGTGTWSLTGSMETARYNHTATLLASGKVLVTGGEGPGNTPLASAEIYDPEMGTWSTASPMAMARWLHTAMLLPSGKVLVTSGLAPDTTLLTSAEVYDPVMDSWNLTGTVAEGRREYTATLLPSGKVLVIGGRGPNGWLASAEVYEPGAALRPLVGPIAPQKPDARFVVRGSGFRGTHGSSGLIRLQHAAGEEFRDLAVEEFSDTSAYVTLPGVSEGYYLLFVLADDVAGGQFLRVDGTPPGAPRVSAPEAFVNTPTPVIAGTAEADSRVTVFLDGTEAGVTETDSMGGWRLTLATALADGVHHAHATATDKAGNVSSSSEVRSFTVDTVPPDAPQVSAPGALVNVSRPTIAGTAEAGSRVKVFVDDIEAGTATADGAGNWRVDPATDLAEGLHRAHATTMDAAGNVSASSEVRSFTIDTLPPDSPQIRAPGAFVNISMPVIAGMAEAGSTVRVVLDGTEAGMIMTNSTGAWSLTPATALGEGVHHAQATATDAAGNTSLLSAVHSFTVDTVRPEAPLLSAPEAFINTQTPVIAGTAEAGSTVRVVLDGTEAGMATADGTGAWSFTPATALGEGAHHAQATATDAAGNVSASSEVRSFTVDTVRPGAPQLSTPGVLVNTSRPVIAGTAEAGSIVRVLLGGTEVGMATANGMGAWSFIPATTLAEGVHHAHATATDAAGNTSLPSEPHSFTVDTVQPAPPQLSGPGAFVNTQKPLIAGTAEPGSQVKVFLDGAEVGTATAGDSGTWNFTPTTGLADGAHEAQALATDAAANVSSSSEVRSFTVDTVRPEAPRVNAPEAFVSTQTPSIGGSAEAGSRVTVFLDGNEAGTAVANTAGLWVFPLATVLAEGGHEARATATDAASNTSQPSEVRSFTVDTVRPEAPQVSAPGGLVSTQKPLIAGTAEAGSRVKVFLDGIEAGTVTADDMGAWSFTPATALTNGVHQAQATATDEADNTSPLSAEHSFTIQRSHYGWGCATSPAFPATWALLALAWALGRRRFRSP